MIRRINTLFSFRDVCCHNFRITEKQTNSYQGENDVNPGTKVGRFLEREFLGFEGSVLQSNDKHGFNRK